MTNEKTIEIEQRIHWKTNRNKTIFGALVPNLSQFLTVKNDFVYFLTAENNVIWCDLEMFERIFERYRNQESVKLPKALADARTFLILKY